MSIFLDEVDFCCLGRKRISKGRKLYNVYVYVIHNSILFISLSNDFIADNTKNELLLLFKVSEIVSFSSNSFLNSNVFSSVNEIGLIDIEPLQWVGGIPMISSGSKRINISFFSFWPLRLSELTCNLISIGIFVKFVNVTGEYK